MRKGIIALAGVMLAGLVGIVSGAGVEADPNKEYLLTPREGPWMVYVASYRGDEDNPDPSLRPREMARRLVLELRGDYKLQAYMFNRSEEKRREQEKALAEWHRRYDAPEQKARARKIRIPDEWAVMVGHYKDLDEASKAAARLKKQPPPKSVKGTQAVMSTKVNNKVEVKGVEMNLLTGAFPCRNPLAPKDSTNTDEEKLDPFLSKLNEGQPYNLLASPKPYTLVVKVYQGATVVVPDQKPSVFNSMRSKESVVDKQFRLFNQSKGQDLENAALMAHSLAKILRHKDLDYPSYVLHTRNASMVTVGSFSKPDDRELLRLQAQLAGKKIGQVDLMAQPMVMKVPQP